SPADSFGYHTTKRGLPESQGRIRGIYAWDWRYRVGFDLRLRREVEGAIGGIRGRDESRIMRNVLQWASRFVSFDALLDALTRGDVSPEVLEEIDPRT